MAYDIRSRLPGQNFVISSILEQRIWFVGSGVNIPDYKPKQKAEWRRTHNSLIPLKYEDRSDLQRSGPDEASIIDGEEVSSLAYKALGEKVKSYGSVQQWSRFIGMTMLFTGM